MPASTDQRFYLHGVSWSTYEALLADVGERMSSLQLTYDGGDLELMSPGGLHDRYKQRFGRMVEDLTFVLDIPIDGCGSTTLRRQDMEKGLEPDEAFYIQNEPRIRGKMDMDLEVDPPPDLAIEIDITSRSVDRGGFYAAIGVPELWRYDGESLRIFRLLPAGSTSGPRSARRSPSCRSPNSPNSSTLSPERIRRPGRSGFEPGSTSVSCLFIRPGEAEAILRNADGRPRARAAVGGRSIGSIDFRPTSWRGPGH